MIGFERVKNIDWSECENLTFIPKNSEEKWKPKLDNKIESFNIAGKVVIKNNEWIEKETPKDFFDDISLEEKCNVPKNNDFGEIYSFLTKENYTLQEWTNNFYDMFIKDLDPNDVVALIYYRY